MRIVAEGSRQILLLWGKARPADTRYRLIRYLVKDEREEGTALLHTVTGELILLSGQEKELLRTVW